MISGVSALSMRGRKRKAARKGREGSHAESRSQGKTTQAKTWLLKKYGTNHTFFIMKPCQGFWCWRTIKPPPCGKEPDEAPMPPGWGPFGINLGWAPGMSGRLGMRNS